jgi:hypothetical protein
MCPASIGLPCLANVTACGPLTRKSRRGKRTVGKGVASLGWWRIVWGMGGCRPVPRLSLSCRVRHRHPPQAAPRTRQRGGGRLCYRPTMGNVIECSGRFFMALRKASNRQPERAKPVYHAVTPPAAYPFARKNPMGNPDGANHQRTT